MSSPTRSRSSDTEFVAGSSLCLCVVICASSSSRDLRTTELSANLSVSLPLVVVVVDSIFEESVSDFGFFFFFFLSMRPSFTPLSFSLPVDGTEVYASEGMAAYVAFVCQGVALRLVIVKNDYSVVKESTA